MLRHCKYHKKSYEMACYTWTIFSATSYHEKSSLQIDQCNISFMIFHNEWIKIVQSTFHVVICLLYEYWDYGISIDTFDRCTTLICKMAVYNENAIDDLRRQQLSIYGSKKFGEKYIVTLTLTELIFAQLVSNESTNNQLDNVNLKPSRWACLFACTFSVEGEHPISDLKVGDWFKVFIEILICSPWMTAPLNRDIACWPWLPSGLGVEWSAREFFRTEMINSLK